MVETYSNASLKHDVRVYLRLSPEECAETDIGGKVGVANVSPHTHFLVTSCLESENLCELSESQVLTYAGNAY